MMRTTRHRLQDKQSKNSWVEFIKSQIKREGDDKKRYGVTLWVVLASIFALGDRLFIALFNIQSTDANIYAVTHLTYLIALLIPLSFVIYSLIYREEDNVFVERTLSKVILSKHKTFYLIFNLLIAIFMVVLENGSKLMFILISTIPIIVYSTGGFVLLPQIKVIKGETRFVLNRTEKFVLWLYKHEIIVKLAVFFAWLLFVLVESYTNLN